VSQTVAACHRPIAARWEIAVRHLRPIGSRIALDIQAALDGKASLTFKRVGLRGEAISSWIG